MVARLTALRMIDIPNKAARLLPKPMSAECREEYQ
jgi:hypothetical protein